MTHRARDCPCKYNSTRIYHSADSDVVLVVVLSLPRPLPPRERVSDIFPCFSDICISSFPDHLSIVPFHSHPDIDPDYLAIVPFHSHPLTNDDRPRDLSRSGVTIKQTRPCHLTIFPSYHHLHSLSYIINPSSHHSIYSIRRQWQQRGPKKPPPARAWQPTEQRLYSNLIIHVKQYVMPTKARSHL